MTKKPKIAKRLRKAFKDAAKLSKEEQRAFAAWLQDALGTRAWEQRMGDAAALVTSSADADNVMVIDAPASTCRDEILACAKTLGKTFSIKAVIDCMQARGSSYKESTIRTHIASKMVTATADRPADLERVSQGVYRLKQH